MAALTLPAPSGSPPPAQSVLLVPVALRGVRYRPSSASKLLSRNLYLYGIGGIIAPFVGIKLIDLLIQFIPGVS